MKIRCYTPEQQNIGKRKLYKQTPQEIREDSIYEQLAETQKVEVDDGYVEFTKHFLYLGSYFSYCPKDDFDISQRIKQACMNMGALKNIWDDPNIDLHSKYLFFLAMPINQLDTMGMRMLGS